MTLLAAVIFFVVCMFVFFFLNLALTAKKGAPAKIFTRLLYLSGIIAAILNGIRIYLQYEGTSGTVLFADAIVVLCLVVGLIKQERPNTDQDKDEEEM